MNTHIVIMAGGIGSRLWPVSTPETPKQFIDLLGVGKSLLQLTVDRFLPVADMSCIWVVTSENYVQTVRQQLPYVRGDQILAEPEPRGTAPCIAYACWKILGKDPDANIVVTPADAIVLNAGKFADVIRKALNFTAEHAGIVTVGISPDRPETGYGYICSDGAEEDKVVKVKAFKEKPTQDVAREYLAAGNYFWNAGIFVWTAETIVSQIRKHSPQIAEMMDRIAASFGRPDEDEVLGKLFPQCEKNSIDYAVMEKSDDIYVIASALEWSDLGSWNSVGKHIPADDGGNRVVGADVRLFGCGDCIVHAGGAGGTVIVAGLEGYIVAAEGGNILVCPVSDDQRIKEFTAKK